MAGPTRYQPSTRVTTAEIPFLSLVTRADPNWAKDKFWQIEYEFTGKNYYANPYNRGVFDTPTKTTNINYPSGSTFAAGDLTGQGFDFVYVLNQNPTPGYLTTRTAAQMFADIAGAEPGMQWVLRIINFLGISALTIRGGAGVTILNAAPCIKPQCFSDFIMTFVDADDMTMVAMTNNNPNSSTSPLVV